jgi:AGCS family alanine or glycine:cation symporter
MNQFTDSINEWVTPLSERLYQWVFTPITLQGQEVPIVVLWLGLTALGFTFYLRFLNVRALRYAIGHIVGRYKHFSSHPSAISASMIKTPAHGQISHFQALSTALSGTVGVGNIGGVAIAIAVGGPGAVFWIFVAGFLAMSTKAIECTLATKFRRESPEGQTMGGPMWYLQKGFSLKGMPRLGNVLGYIYAVAILLASFGIGNMFQSNQAYAQTAVLLEYVGAGDYASKWVFGCVLSVIVALVILGGIKSIARVASAVVPVMALLYIVSALIVLVVHYEYVPQAFKWILVDAFNSKSVEGGIIGCILIGFQRALFSNEAGLGSASIAHAAVKTQEPASEGLVSLLEPMIDSMLILMLSSLVILTVAIPQGLMAQGLEGIELTSAAFSITFSWFPVPLAIAACLFAFSTILAWSYYGLQAWEFLVGTELWKQRLFNTVFCLFIVLGAVSHLDAIIDISDALVFIAAVPNLIGLYVLAPIARAELEDYLSRLKIYEKNAFKPLSPGKVVG